MTAQIIQFPKRNRQFATEAGILAMMDALNRVNAKHGRPAINDQRAAETFFEQRAIIKALEADDH